jgi:hypothetical protein
MENHVVSIKKYEVNGCKLNNITKEVLCQIQHKLLKYGVVVLNDVFSERRAKRYQKESIKWLTDLLDPLTTNKETWTNNNLPTGPRKGMYQSIVGHCPVAWRLREKLYPLFCNIWGTKELITSIDGATIWPPVEVRTKSEDWSHIDQQTCRSEKRCYQGQVVLGDSTAVFRCTPKSHLKHKYFRENYGFNFKEEWYKFTEEQIKELKETFKDNYQIPIYSKSGSVILWESCTVHSSKYVDNVNEYKNSTDPFAGWRTTYYICQRPKSHLTKRNLTTIGNAAKNGRTTNHSSSNIFPKEGRYDNMQGNEKHPQVRKILKNPEKYIVQELTPLQKKLVGLMEY